MDAPLSPACVKCHRVTGKETCFPGPCVFFHERNLPGTKACEVATLDRIRSIPDTTPNLHQQLIDTIDALLKKHEAYHNSIEHAAARQLLRKIRGEA